MKLPLKGQLKGSQRGFALVYTLWSLVFLSALATIIFRSMQLDMRVSHHDRELIQLRWIAKAGIEKSIAILLEDETNYDAFIDNWSVNEETLQDFDLGPGAFYVNIYDESGKLNLNTASKKQLMSLPKMNDEIAAAILDWRDRDQKVQPSGVEGAYYQSLQPPYPIRNGPFRSLQELLLVKGMTKELFYGEDYNLNRRLDANENDGDAFYPNDNQDGKLDLGLAAYLTCYSYESNIDPMGKEKLYLKNASERDLERTLNLPRKYAKWIKDKHSNAKSLGDLISRNSPADPEKAGNRDSEPIDLVTYKNIFNLMTTSKDERFLGKVNINTASLEVLNALCEGDETLAHNLYSFRLNNMLPILNITELIDYQPVGIEGFKKLVDKLCVNSNIFQAHSLALSHRSNAHYQIEAYLHRQNNDINIIYWHQGAVQ